jgi:hypothetical protein
MWAMAEITSAHQLVAHFVLDLVDVSFRRVLGDFKQQLTGQGIAVGMQAIRGQAQEDVSDFHLFAGDDLVFFDDAKDKAGEVVFALRVEAGHFGSFAANQGAAIVLAGFGDAFDHFLRHLGFELAGSEVVHEKHGRSALHHDVVDAMIDQVGAHGVVDLHLEGDLQLGAHAVDARHQHRIEIGFGDGEQASEAADLAQNSLGEGFVGEVLDALLGAIGAIDAHARIGIGDTGGLWGFLGQANQSVV